jgi:hypothetical protein
VQHKRRLAKLSPFQSYLVALWTGRVMNNKYIVDKVFKGWRMQASKVRQFRLKLVSRLVFRVLDRWASFAHC